MILNNTLWKLLVRILRLLTKDDTHLKGFWNTKDLSSFNNSMRAFHFCCFLKRSTMQSFKNCNPHTPLSLVYDMMGEGGGRKEDKRAGRREEGKKEKSALTWWIVPRTRQWSWEDNLKLKQALWRRMWASSRFGDALIESSRLHSNQDKN